MSASATGVLGLKSYFLAALLFVVTVPATGQNPVDRGQVRTDPAKTDLPKEDLSNNTQSKAEKDIRKITALAATPIARDIIGATMAGLLNVPRMELVRERREMNLNYGSLFIAQQLVKNGATISNISQRLKAGKTIGQVANEQNANWKSISGATKKLNGKIQDSIYKYFLHPEVGKQRALAENYDPEADLVQADLDTTREEVQAAHEEYVLWRNRAAATSGHPLDAAAEGTINKDLEVFKGTQRPH